MVSGCDVLIFEPETKISASRDGSFGYVVVFSANVSSSFLRLSKTPDQKEAPNRNLISKRDHDYITERSIHRDGFFCP